MSFILDALKLSRQRRRDAGVPDLFTVHEPPLPPRRRGLAAAAGLLLLALMAAAWFWRPRAPVQNESPSIPSPRMTPSMVSGPEAGPRDGQAAGPRHPSPAEATVAEPGEGEVTSSVPAPGEAPAPPSVAAPVAPSLSAPPYAIAPLPVTALEEPSEEIVGETPGVPEALPVETAPEPAPQSPPPGVVSMEELPAEIRGSLPPLDISGHIWSEKTSFRRLTVNGQVRREGDPAAAGVRLVEITEEGAVFEWRGYRFRAGM